MKKVDIIVPVYNAYEYTVECVNSIFNNTDLNVNTLILINDKSPDERIQPMLEKIVQNNNNKNVVLLRNEENLGFVKTVNRGMKYSDNDVILLNSDTEVTKNWIKNIIKCAYSNDYIATVTPLTNNGTIASVPNFGIDNELPRNMSLSEYSDMIEKISVSRYPQLTTGNGFCMFIKRKVIDEIGLFDDKTFEKGYGEENDFCYRALDHGYINVLCDNVFIYHKGTQSFKKENLTASRAAIIDEHMRLLRNKHPIYVKKTDEFLRINPISDIQENVRFNTLLYNTKKILYLVNEWEENMEMTGGTSLHIKDLISANLNNGIASFVFAPNKHDLSRFDLFLYIGDFSKKIASYKTDIYYYGQVNYTNNTYRNILNNIFNCFKIDILHVHHLLFQTFDSIDIAKKFGVYSIITLHDLYMICPSVNMVYNDIYCKYDEKKDCLKCLKRRFGVNSDFLENWQMTCKEVLKKFDKILLPSNNTKRIFEDMYQDLNFEVIEHGVELVDAKIKNNNLEANEKCFNIAFVGAMAIHKGSNILKSLVRMNSGTNIKIHLFGKSSDKVLNANSKNYINHGEYRRGELPQLLIDNNIDLVCIFATWPETYSYTLTESYMAQIPILTFDLGAVGDRVKNDGLGWTIKFTKDCKLIFDKINEIRNNKYEYNMKKNNFKKYKYKSLFEMQESYLKIYNEATSERKLELTDIYSFKNYLNNFSKFEFDSYILNYGHVINKYEKLRSSSVWKLAKKVKSKIKGK